MKVVEHFLELTKEQLDKVTDCGRNMMPPSDIPYIIGVDRVCFEIEMDDESSDVRAAYMKGFAETSFNIHEMNRELAEAGSPMAIADVLRSYAYCRNELER